MGLGNRESMSVSLLYRRLRSIPGNQLGHLAILPVLHVEADGNQVGDHGFVVSHVTLVSFLHTVLEDRFLYGRSQQ